MFSFSSLPAFYLLLLLLYCGVPLFLCICIGWLHSAYIRLAPRSYGDCAAPPGGRRWQGGGGQGKRAWMRGSHTKTCTYKRYWSGGGSTKASSQHWPAQGQCMSACCIVFIALSDVPNAKGTTFSLYCMAIFSDRMVWVIRRSEGPPTCFEVEKKSWVIRRTES